MKDRIKSRLKAQAEELLSLTQNGDELIPPDRILVQRAHDGRLSAFGRPAFENLYSRVKRTKEASSQTTATWFHAIEHLTLADDGMVYWKGAAVEHFSQQWSMSEEGRLAAERVARRCQYLEEQSIRPSIRTVAFEWDEYCPAEEAALIRALTTVLHLIDDYHWTRGTLSAEGYALLRRVANRIEEDLKKRRI